MILALTVSLALAAAETDQYYSWIVDVDDGADAINARVRRDFADRLAAVNARTDRAQMSCSDVAGELVAPYWTAGTWFVIGATKDWGFPYRPANASERTTAFARASIYRNTGLLPFGIFVPVDPTIRVDGIYFGTDKLSHFLHNSWRYWETYSRARAAGKSERDALRAAYDRGIAQEAGILGALVASSFSYADLEVNAQGLEHLRAWCERGDLALVDGSWRLAEEFDIRRWVTPCWDESWYTNAFSGLTGDGVRAALHELCATRDTPRMIERFRSYRARQCSSESARYLDELVARGALPDPTPYTVDAVCADPRAPTRAGAYRWSHGEQEERRSRNERNEEDVPAQLPWPLGRADGRGPVGACFPRRRGERGARGAGARRRARGHARVSARRRRR
jgi:hypothetical protein